MTMTPDAGAKSCGPRGDARRRAILDAAWTLFLEKGFERTTLGDIIALSGGSRSTLYEQFGDKDGLFETAIMLKCSEFIARMREIPLDDGDPERALTNRPEIHRMRAVTGEPEIPAPADRQRRPVPEGDRRLLHGSPRRGPPDPGRLPARGDQARPTPRHRPRPRRHDLPGLPHGDQQLKMLLRPERLATPEELKAFVEGVVRIFLNGVRQGHSLRLESA